MSNIIITNKNKTAIAPIYTIINIIAINSLRNKKKKNDPIRKQIIKKKIE
jgi:hypothetical protein